MWNTKTGPFNMKNHNYSFFITYNGHNANKQTMAISFNIELKLQEIENKII